MLEKPKQKEEDINKTRRSLLAGAGAAAISAVLGRTNEAIAHPIPKGPNIPEKFKEVYNYMLNFYSELNTLKEVEEAGPNAWVWVETLKINEVPIPDGQKVLSALGKDSALIIIKKLNTFILMYKEGEEIKVHKGPIGTGKVSAGYYTPEGVYPVTRKEGPNYKAQALETRGADMGYAVFFNYGIAFHRSENYRILDGQLFLHRDNSHGCANGTEGDAIKVHEQMQIGEHVVVLP